MDINAIKAELQAYIDTPTECLSFDRIRIGRIRFEGIQIRGRGAAINMEEMIRSSWERSDRTRKTRYPEPLPVGRPARLLSVEAADYLKDMGRRKLAKRTIEMSERVLQMLRIVTGDIPVNRIEHTHIYQLWDLWRWAPPFLTTSAEFVGWTVEAIIARGKADLLTAPSDKSMETYGNLLRTFFNRLKKHQAIPQSPMAAFPRAKAALMSQRGADRLLSSADLLRIFDPTTFVPWASKYPHLWWGTMIGLYTGARINEVSQLKLADIVREDGTWCFDFRMTEDEDLHGKSRQRFKGASSIRKVPIAQPLLDAGFLDFIEDIRACGHPRLFPNLSAGINRTTGESNDCYSMSFIGQYSRYLKTLGFAKGVAFHAFRHTLATRLVERGASLPDVALITGHSEGSGYKQLKQYVHVRPAVLREKQAATLALFDPPVVLPRYERGQFKHRPGIGAKKYP